MFYKITIADVRTNEVLYVLKSKYLPRYTRDICDVCIYVHSYEKNDEPDKCIYEFNTDFFYIADIKASYKPL